MAKLGNMAFRNIHKQLSFLERPEVEAAIAGMAKSGAESRGAVFTRREVVDFILDLAGYTTDKPLHEARPLEPLLSGTISTIEPKKRSAPRFVYGPLFGKGLSARKRHALLSVG